MTITLYQDQRDRRAKKRMESKLACLTPAIDRVTDGDCVFFEQNPDRKHRLRLACQAEVEEYEIVHGGRPILPPDYWMFIVVRCVAPGLRMRLRAFMRKDHTDTSDAFARGVFEQAGVECPELLQAANRLRAAL
jgi:hypothetical protein